MSEPIGVYPRVRLEGGGSGVVSQGWAVLLVETVRKLGLDTAISAAMAPWHKPRTVHDPGKVLLDVALEVALGGDCLADVAMLRAEPDMFGPVASDPHGLPAHRRPRRSRAEGAHRDPRSARPKFARGSGSWPARTVPAPVAA